MALENKPKKNKCSESNGTKNSTVQEQDETDCISVVTEQTENIATMETSQTENSLKASNVNMSENNESLDIQSTVSCIDCVKPIPVRSRNKIKPGDHILFVRSLYDHHAIVIEVNPLGDEEHLVALKLIHQTNSAFGAVRDSIRPRRRIARLKCKVITVNLHTEKTLICKYWGKIKPYPRQEVIERAQNALDKRKQQFEYDLLDNNCEHFATWCVTGRQLSVQTRKIRLVLRLFYKKGFRGVSDELARNEFAFKYGILCETCYERNKPPLSVERKPIDNKNDVNKGDIIMYKYYKLWHCAVVLDVLKRKEKCIKCQIAHYAFCGPLSHRTIRAEPLKIPLDQSVVVFVYPQTFHLYDPEEVVERAKTRIGEQMFVFFSNDSSTFSRWCKLKLK